MKIKRFTAGNMQAGLKTISETLGPEAVILSNRRLSNGLEIVAGVDEAEYELYLDTQPKEQTESDIIKADDHQPPVPLDSDTMKQLFAAMSDKNHQAFADHVKVAEKEAPLTEQPSSRSRMPIEPIAAPSAPAPQLAVSDLALLRQEIDGLKGMLKAQAEQLKEPEPVPEMSPQYERLESRMMTLGFSNRLTSKLLSQYDREEPIEINWRKAMGRLLSAIPTPLYDPLGNGGIYAFTGPTGAGKSTTIAKLAALAVRDHGQDSVALISLDWFQVGGQEILNSVSSILGIDYFPLTAKDSLENTLIKLAEKRLILIDTSGSTQAITHWNGLMKQARLKSRIQTLLVMPSNMHPASINQFINQHSKKAFAAVVLSKLDESAGFGGVLEPVLKNSWPVWFCTTGQNIPQDIEKADSKKLVQRLVCSLAPEKQPLEAVG